MPTYKTEFSRFKVNSFSPVEIEKVTVEFKSVRRLETIADDDSEALERFITRAWKVMYKRPEFPAKPGWSSWMNNEEFEEVKNG